MLNLLLLSTSLVLAPDPRSDLTNYIPMEVSAPSGDLASNIKVTLEIPSFILILFIKGVHPHPRTDETGLG